MTNGSAEEDAETMIAEKRSRLIEDVVNGVRGALNEIMDKMQPATLARFVQCSEKKTVIHEIVDSVTECAGRQCGIVLEPTPSLYQESSVEVGTPHREECQVSG